MEYSFLIRPQYRLFSLGVQYERVSLITHANPLENCVQVCLFCAETTSRESFIDPLKYCLAELVGA